MRLKLITKFTIVTSAVLIVTMVFFVVISVKTQEKMCISNSIQEVENLSETLVRTTHYQMLEDDRKRVYQMMDEVGSQKGMERIRLLNKDGIIKYSTLKSEIGAFVDSRTEGCDGCHGVGGNQPLTHLHVSGRSRVFYKNGGQKILGMTKAIYNKPSCYTAACHFHSKDVQVLGILDVQMSLASRMEQAATFRNNIVILTMVLLLMMTLSLTFLTQKLVNQPVRSLLSHARKVARGELNVSIDKNPSDELGDLGGAFNDMTSNLKKAQDELKNWANTLEAKVEERTLKLQQVQSKLIRSEKLASLGELVAGIAHEINNPLSGILMFSSLMVNDKRLDPALRNDLETILRETKRCSEIVKGLLEFARESIPEKVNASLNSIMDKTMALVKNQSTFHNIQILKDYDHGLPSVLVDPNQIEQVFINIVTNASHAMEGGGILTLSTGLDVENRRVWTKVQDTGTGMPAETIEKIFDPFFTTKEHRGTGLGLSVSYGIIENHGGSIEVDSQVGHGTTFIIWLPLDPVDPPPNGKNIA